MTLPVQQALIAAAAPPDLGAIISVLPPEEIAAAGGLQADEADGLLAHASPSQRRHAGACTAILSRVDLFADVLHFNLIALYCSHIVFSPLTTINHWFFSSRFLHYWSPPQVINDSNDQWFQ